MKGKIATFFAITISVLITTMYLINPTLGATTDTTNITVTVGRLATVLSLTSIPRTDPLEDREKAVTFNCSVYDTEGSGDLTLNGVIFKEGAENKSADCVVVAGGEEDIIINYTCSFDMNYSDIPGDWSYECDATGGDSITDTMSSTFSYGELRAWQMDKQLLSFGTIEANATEVPSEDNPLTLTNTGNEELGLINVTALDLVGETLTEKTIPAEEFSVNAVNATGGNAMENNTAVTISGTSLGRGEKQGLYFYIEEVPSDLPYQVYDTSTLGGWTISTPEI